MTNKEAIMLLKSGTSCNSDCENCEKCTEVRYQQALTLAIKALEERPQGEWIRHHIPFTYMGYTHFSCSECNYGDDIKLEKTYNFCPNCGADMRGAK